MVLISDVFEEDGHPVFSAVGKYFAVKLRYLETRWHANPLGLWSWRAFAFEELSVFSFTSTRKASKLTYSTKGTGSVLHCFKLFYIFLGIIGWWVLHLLLGMDWTIREVSWKQTRLREAMETVRTDMRVAFVFRAAIDESGQVFDEKVVELAFVVWNHQQIYVMFLVSVLRGIEEKDLFSKTRSLTLMVGFKFSNLDVSGN